MKRPSLLRFFILSAALFLSISVPAHADRLRLRLARTERQGEVSPELQEVSEILLRNLNLGSCVLLDETTISFPQDRKTLKLRGYWIDMIPQGEGVLQVSIFRKEKRILQSTVRISTEAPLILGGFRPNAPRKRKPRIGGWPSRPERCGDGTEPAPAPHHGMLPATAPNPAVMPAPGVQLPTPPIPPPQFSPGIRHILILERLPEAAAEDVP